MQLLEETKLLDFSNPMIRNLVGSLGWKKRENREMILSIYNFIRDEIQFGYNADDTIPASTVLMDGYGQCNTKSILFMALLRACGIPCRIHGFAIDKHLQRGAISGLWYLMAQKEIIHCWVELEFDGKWVNLEGFILDIDYLQSVQKKNSKITGPFCGYGVATDCLANPKVYWDGGDTYIQNEGIVRDFGVFESPDEFFSKHRQSLGPVKRWVYTSLTRHQMNRNIQRIRNR